MREYVAVMTRPVEANGLGLDPADAAANALEVLAIARVLGEGSDTTDRLIGLLTETGISGTQVHDANIVACALTHGAAAIVTDNVRHFGRFASLIQVEPLSGVLGSSGFTPEL